MLFLYYFYKMEYKKKKKKKNMSKGKIIINLKIIMFEIYKKFNYNY